MPAAWWISPTSSRRARPDVRDFIVFEDDGSRIVKMMAGCHQSHAVQVAVDETVRAAELHRAGYLSREEQWRYEAGHSRGGNPGDRRVGVVWHTQGSGKSLTMAFYAGRIIREPTMSNPTLIVLAARNDLDDQHCSTFVRCRELLRQPPEQAESRARLRALLSVSAGGVVFTTIYKFFPYERGDRYPLLSDRRNIVVIADESHRSQYDFIDGYARQGNARSACVQSDARRVKGAELPSIATRNGNGPRPLMAMRPLNSGDLK